MHMIKMRGIFSRLAAAAITAIALVGAVPAMAAWAPTQPIKIIVPYGAGGSTDVFARVVAAAWEKQTGWTIIVENRTGAGGVIGQTEVMNAKPDGHTFSISGTTLFALEPFLPESTSELRPEKFDFLGTMSVIPYAIVAKPDAAYNDLKELGEYTRANGPAKFSATSNMLTLAFQEVTEDFGISFVAAQTEGSGESLQLVAGGHADITISGGVHVPYVAEGRMKVLAHLADDRGSYAPDVLTVEEQGGVLPLRNYFMLSGPKGLPADVKEAVAKTFDDALQTEAVQAHAKAIHVTLRNLGPEGTQADVMAQAENWKAILAK